jgi:serine protease Do
VASVSKATGRKDAPDYRNKPMKQILRLALASTVGCLCIGPMAHAIPAQRDPAPPTAQASEGYLGIVCGDVTSDRISALKLKQASGAEIMNVDRDAPAGKIGLRPHDVILKLNGQPVAGEEMLRRMLRETPAGRAVTLLISRDGQQQIVTVQLADRAILEQDAWSQPMMIPAPDDDDTYVLEGPSGHAFGSGFFGALSLGSPSVGVELDVLGPQLADYFGVKDGQGLLVKRVAENSAAARSGLKAGDVIIEANGQKMATLGGWMKMLHANRGKQIPLTVIRNRKDQNLTLQTGARKSHSWLQPGGLSIFDTRPGPGVGWIDYQLQ